MIVFDASVVSAALREGSVPARALLHAEQTDIFALSAAVDGEIGEVLNRPRFAGAITATAGSGSSRHCGTRRLGSIRLSK